MELTKEYLQQKIDEYSQKKEFHTAQAAACAGAIQANKELLDKLNEQPSPETQK